MRFSAPHPSERRPLSGASAAWLLPCLLAGLTAVAPARAQDPAELIGVFSTPRAASAPAPAAPPPAANARLVQQAERATQRDDARIQADITARLARNPAFGGVQAVVEAGVASLTGHVGDDAARQLAAKIAGAVGGVVAVDNALVLQTRFSTRLFDTWRAAKDRLEHNVAMVPLLLLALAVVWLANLLGRWLSDRLRVARLDNRNPYLGTLIRRAVRTGFVLAGVLIALDLLEATALVTAVLGSAGVVGIMLGFAFRDMAENYLSGILLSLRRPFEPGDYVRIDSYEGRVVSLSTRNTVLMTLDGTELRLPNATVFKGVLLNFTHNPRRRFTFQLGVAYGEDLRRAQDLGVETMTAMEGVLKEPAPSAALDQVGDSSVTINYYAWVDQRQTDFFKARSEAIRLVKTALESADMDLPEPIYRVQLTTPLPAAALAAAQPAPADKPIDPRALARTQADVSPSTDLDVQIAQERARKADTDMLQTPGGRAD